MYASSLSNNLLWGTESKTPEKSRCIYIVSTHPPGPMSLSRTVNSCVTFGLPFIKPCWQFMSSVFFHKCWFTSNNIKIQIIKKVKKETCISHVTKNQNTRRHYFHSHSAIFHLYPFLVIVINYGANVIVIND